MTTITEPQSASQSRPGRIRRLILAGGLAAGIATGTATAADAVGGFHTSASAVRVRAAATTQSAQVSSISSAGTPIDLACQTSGETVSVSGFGSSPIWDKLNGYGGGYISDLFVQETAYAQFDSRLPRCPINTTTREEKALTWAYGELGHYTDDWGRATTNWCARWSVGAYGQANSGYSTAWNMYLGFRSMGLTHSGPAPAGTFVFFYPALVNGYAGHVAISDGNGGMITTTATFIQHTSLAYAKATYLGWSYAPAGWTR